MTLRCNRQSQLRPCVCIASPHNVRTPLEGVVLLTFGAEQASCLVQVTEKRLKKAGIISDVVDGVNLDKRLLDSLVIDYGSSSVDCGGLFPKSQASPASL